MALPVLANKYTGQTVITGNDLSVSIGATVVLSKSFVIFSLSGSSGAPKDYCIRGNLVDAGSDSATQIRFRRVRASGTFTIEWQVLEFTSGVTVQHFDLIDFGTNPLNLTVSLTDYTKAFPLITMDEDSSGWDRGAVYADITSNTNITLSIVTAATQVKACLQVIEFESDAVIEKVTGTLSDATASTDITITSVDSTKTFIMGSMKSQSQVQYNNNAIPNWALTSSTNIHVERVGSVSPGWDLIFYVVTLDNITVERGEVNMASSTTGTITHALTDYTQSFVYINGLNQTWGRGPDTNDSSADVCVRLITDSNTQTTWTKHTAQTGSYFNWSTIEFGSASSGGDVSTTTNPLISNFVLNNVTVIADFYVSQPVLELVANFEIPNVIVIDEFNETVVVEPLLITSEIVDVTITNQSNVDVVVTPLITSIDLQIVNISTDVLYVSNLLESSFSLIDVIVEGESDENVVVSGLDSSFILPEISVFLDHNIAQSSLGVSIVLNDVTVSTPIAGDIVYRVNAGASSFTDSQGRDWEAETGYFTLTSGSGGTFTTVETISNTNNLVDGTTDEVLYQSERWGSYVWSFPIDNGDYRVVLHFAEIYAPADTPGERVFDVYTEGLLVIDNYDIVADVGQYYATTQEYNTTVSDGQLDISFIAVVDNPKISGIEIYTASNDVNATVIVEPLIVSSTIPESVVNTSANVDVTPLVVSLTTGTVKALISTYGTRLYTANLPFANFFEESSGDQIIFVNPLEVSLVSNPIVVSSEVSISSDTLLIGSELSDVTVNVDFSIQSEVLSFSFLLNVVTVDTTIGVVNDTAIVTPLIASFVENNIVVSTSVNHESGILESNFSIQNVTASTENIILVTPLEVVSSLPSVSATSGIIVNVDPLILNILENNVTLNVSVNLETDPLIIGVSSLDVSVSSEVVIQDQANNILFTLNNVIVSGDSIVQVNPLLVGIQSSDVSIQTDSVILVAPLVGTYSLGNTSIEAGGSISLSSNVLVSSFSLNNVSISTEQVFSVDVLSISSSLQTVNVTGSSVFESTTLSIPLSLNEAKARTSTYGTRLYTANLPFADVYNEVNGDEIVFVSPLEISFNIPEADVYYDVSVSTESLIFISYLNDVSISSESNISVSGLNVTSTLNTINANGTIGSSDETVTVTPLEVSLISNNVSTSTSVSIIQSELVISSDIPEIAVSSSSSIGIGALSSSFLIPEVVVICESIVSVNVLLSEITLNQVLVAGQGESLFAADELIVSVTLNDVNVISDREETISVDSLNIGLNLNTSILSVDVNISSDELIVPLILNNSNVSFGTTVNPDTLEVSISIDSVETNFDYIVAVNPLVMSVEIPNVASLTGSLTQVNPLIVNIGLNQVDSQVSITNALSPLIVTPTLSNVTVNFDCVFEVSSLTSTFSLINLYLVGDTSDHVQFPASPLAVSITIPNFEVCIFVSDYASLDPFSNNGYFDPILVSYDSESSLYDNLLCEHYNINGVEMVYYIVDYDSSYDKVFGEDLDRYVERNFEIMAHYELPKEEEIWSSFGIEGIDNFHMYISKKHFREASTYSIDGVSSSYDVYIPKQGDVIRSKYNKYYYEVVTVKEETEMFHQRKHSWDLVVKPYKQEDLTLSATTSASMPNFHTVVSASDIFNNEDNINTSKDSILYEPLDGEDSSNDPFASW